MVALRVVPLISTVVEPRARRRSKAAPAPAAAMSNGAICDSLASRYTDWIAEALDDLTASFLITDPAISGHPIVFASRGFLSMSGFPLEEVIGRNGRIFQGPATDRRSVMEIREAIREEQTVQISLLNCRRDNTFHSILFHLCPVFAAADGRVVHFVAVQVPIPRPSNGSRGMLLTTCRDEIAFDSFEDSNNRVLEAEESLEASDWERQKASSTADDILSTLVRYSNFAGKPVTGKRTDPHLPDMPIVYASDAFLSLTGYSRDEVLGRNCRFLSGPDTNADVLHQVRSSIKVEKACTVQILNYRRDGSSFWNLLHISPVRNASGKIAFYVGVQVEGGPKYDGHGLSPEMRQLGAVGAVKVAVRSLSANAGPSRPL